MKKLLTLFIAATCYLYSSPAYAQAPGNALEFAGTPAAQNSIFVPNGGSHPLDITGSITIETWIRPTRKTISDEANKWSTIMMKGSYGYGLVIGDDNCQSSAVGRLGYWGQNSCGAVPFSTTAIEYGKWNHVAVVISSGSLTFYINGEAAGTASGVSIPNGGAGSSLYIGVQDRTSGGNGWYKGAMDEVRIWNTARTANEIKTNMYREVDPSSAGLVTYFRYDQGTAAGSNTAITTADDLTSNNLDGTLDQFTLTGTASNFVESYAMVVPKSLAATNVSSTGFTANWEAPEVGTVTNYVLDVAADKNFNTIISGYNDLDVGTGTSYNVTGLAGYNSYYYRLRADKASVTGTGAKSGSVLVSVPVAGLGKAISFERSRNEGMQVSHHSGFNFGTGSYTIESWIKRSAGSGFFTIVGKQTAAAAGLFLRFNNNTISFAAGQYPASTDVSSVSAISDNNWHHIAAVTNISDKTMKIYIDGVLDVSQTFGTLYTVNTSAALGVGFKPNFGEYFDGNMDEVRIWNTARTASQIKEYMNTPLSGTESGLVAYWNFEEGTGTSVDDLSNNTNIGTLQNSDGDEWSDGNITYSRTINEDEAFTLRIGGSDLAAQSSSTAFVSQRPANGKLYQTNDGTTKGTEITSTGIFLTDPEGNPRRLIYEPSTNFNGTDLFKYQVNNGAVNSANTETVNISINAVNDAPVITSNGGAASASVAVQENTIAVTTVTATDAEAGTITFSIAGGADQSKFSIDGSTGVLTFTSAPDFETPGDADLNNTYVVIVRASDGTAATDQTVTVTISDADDTAPATPTGLTATSGNTQVTLNWTANPEGDLSGYRVYGGTGSNPTTLLQTVAAPTTTYTVSGLTNGTAYYYRISAIDNTGNESAASADVSAIPKAGQTITFNALTAKTYGDNSFTLSATASSGLSVSYLSSDPAVASVSGNTVTILKAGSTIITASQSGNSNFNAAADVPQTLVVNTKTITVAADTKTKIYGDTDPAVTYTFTPALISGDSFSGSLSRAAGEDKGTYAINQGTLALSNNYTLTFNPSALTITPKNITVTAGAKTKIYGDTDPALTYTFTPALISGDSFTGTLSRTAGEEKGTYAINQGTLALSSNYTLTFNPSALTINPKDITVTADTKTKTYGDADPALTYTFTPTLITGDSFTGTLSRTAGEEKGTYAINQGTLALNSNYTLTFNPSALTINPKNITVAADAKTKTYGDADPALTYIFTPALISGDSFNGSLSRAVGEYKGSYTINQGTLALSNNYTLTFNPSALTITPKNITVTADAKTKTYGDADPALTYTFTPALISGDSFNGSLSRTAGEDKGTYAISQGMLALSNNYTLTFNPSALTITPKNITVTADAKTKTYGDADPALTYTFTPTLITGDSFTGTLSRTAGEDKGTYAISQGMLALSNNYTLTFNPSALTITPKNITVTADAKTKTYGDADPALTYIFTPALISGDSFNGSLSRAVGEYKGTYAINQGTLALSSNYTLTFTPSALTINPKDITVTADMKTKIYGDADPALTYTFTPVLISGDSFSGSLSRTAGEDKGTYAINQGTLALSSNYTLVFQPSALTINPKNITVTADNKVKLQGTANPGLTISYSGFINGENMAVLTALPVAYTTATFTSPIGTYPIILSGGSAANYSFNFVSGILTVAPGLPTGISLEADILFENRPAGIRAGIFSSSSNDPDAVYTYSLVSGPGDTDNGLFAISGNELRTSASLDYEKKSIYNIRVRSATQYGLSFDKELAVSIRDVNEAPTLEAVNIAPFCFNNSAQTQPLAGISPGPETGQDLSISVSSTNSPLFDQLAVSTASGGNAILTYRLKSAGTADVTITVTDGGDTLNGGINMFSRTFTITAYALPKAIVSSNTGTGISKGDVALLTASGGTAYQWNGTQGIISGQNSAVLTIRPEQTATYRVTVTNASGCSTFQDITINVAEDYKLDANNLLSPNGDGINDNLVIKNIDMYPNNELKIFDRAGRLIYSKKNYTNDWDGTFQSSPLAEDTYFYLVDFGSGYKGVKGYVTIVRDR